MDNPTLDVIHEKYLTCLRTFAKKHFPNQPNRVEELLVRLPEVSYLLSEYIVASKYIYNTYLNIPIYFRFKRQRLSSWNPRCFMCHSY